MEACLPTYFPEFLAHVHFIDLDLPLFDTPQGLCKSLKGLMISGNPQRSIKQQHLSRGPLALIAYLRQQIPQDSPLYLPPPNCDDGRPLHTEAMVSEEVQRLQESITGLQNQLEEISLSQAKKYALKKQLARCKADLIREERRTQQRMQ